MTIKSYARFAALLAVLALLMGTVGCAKKGRAPQGVMDTPEHHFNVGLDFLNSGAVNDAAREFDLALGLDAKYPPALAAKGLVTAVKGDDAEAAKLLRRANQLGRNKKGPLRMWPLVLEIRTYAVQVAAGRITPTQLVLKVREPLAQGKVVDAEYPPLYFWAGEAYLQALEFDKSEEMFSKVLDLQRGFEDRAKARWELIQKVRRAAPGTVVGKRIALVERISRADLAALLVEELNVVKFYSRTNDIQAPAFQEPATARPERYNERGAADVAGHALAADIDKVLEYGVKGMELYPDNTFRPDEQVSRAEAAMIFEDVIVRATGKDELATRYIGQESSVADVRGDHPAFNAIMLITTRGIMETNVRSGGFDPLGPVAGVDALLAIQRLKSELSLF